MPARSGQGRRVSATFGQRPIAVDADWERGQSAHLRDNFTIDERLGIYDRFGGGHTRFDAVMRRVVMRSLVRALGDDVTFGPGFHFLHPETFEIGDGCFFGAGSFVQGRFDGTCRFGKRCWIGPGAYLDARDLVLGDFVGWGPGARALGSEHVGDAIDRHVIETDLVIAPIRVGNGADVGTNAVILPGVIIGDGSIIGAGAVVTADVEPRAVVAGVPARKIRSRESQ
jgi:acetyltransferase-like isoleucine patch superfamily enzyme